ncbi:hypothetical protein BDF20DRAFT_988578 [Mycotypha africana]|uniref:uncharacterized protein n=1 Tax=Mycotypha africana TaxID=64632 RepID=UPI002300E64E|nr:uncharacterized protein BDF20DRAFT_988578 [Mycotypha africana]KAI8977673.1 hypothetical protein BDF20DRAFT_988578 [Mycotypha africana]
MPKIRSTTNMTPCHSTSNYSPTYTYKEQTFSPFLKAKQPILPPLTLPSPETIHYSDTLSPITAACEKNTNITCHDIRLPTIKELDYNNFQNTPLTCQAQLREAHTESPQQQYRHRTGILYKPYPLPTDITEQRTPKKNVKQFLREEPKNQNNENNKKKRAAKPRNRCHSCNSTETPEWRRGPLGPRTLCNACGLIWIKLSKKDDEKVSPLFTTAPPLPTTESISSKEDSVTFPNEQRNPSIVNDNTLSKKKLNTEKFTLSYLLS